MTLRRGLSLLLLLLLLPLPAFGQRVDPQDPLLPALPVRSFAEDNHALRFILKYMVKVEAAKVGENDGPLADLDPKETALVILGEMDWLKDRDERIAFGRFIRAGGSVLIATHRTTPNAVQEALGVRVVGEPVTARDNTLRDTYRGRPDCPLLREFNTSYSIFQGVETIATVRPGEVEAMGRRHRAIAVAPFPASCAREDAKNIPNFAMICEPMDFSGRILVLSDERVFLNSTMLQQDNDNFDFAFNCMRWLCDAEDGPPRLKTVRLVHDGVPLRDFEVQVKSIPNTVPPEALPDLPAHPVDLANAILAKWEDENIHNELLLSIFDRDPHRQGLSWRSIVSALAVVVSIVLIAYGLFRLQQAHSRVETGP